MMKRGVGYCKDEECEDFNKGVFLLNHGNTFHCPRCRREGLSEPEAGEATGTGKTFKRVEVEFDFDPRANRYQQTAIITDNSIESGKVYQLRSPLIRTERRALNVAEAILANLNHFGMGGDGMPKTTETILSFDEPYEKFSQACLDLHLQLAKSNLLQQ